MALIVCDIELRSQFWQSVDAHNSNLCSYSLYVIGTAGSELKHASVICFNISSCVGQIFISKNIAAFLGGNNNMF